MTNLIPEQVSFLRKEIKSYEDRLIKRGYTLDNGVLFAPEKIASYLTDEEVLEEIRSDIKELSKLRETLTRSTYLRERPKDKIGVGTRCVIAFAEDDKEEVTLVEESVNQTLSNGLISIGSPLGKSIKDKKEKDKFNYMVNNFNIEGIIDSVEYNDDEYLSFLRKEDDNVLERVITESQLELLMEEKERMTKKADGRERVEFIEKILKEATVAKKPADNKVGVGSKFKIEIFNTINPNYEYELINKAVTDELADSFMEVNSEIGSNILGLSNNESFNIEGKNGNIKGKVYDLK